MLKRKSILPSVALFLLAALLLASCARASTSSSTTTTGVGTVTQITVVTTVDATGSIAPRQLASIPWQTSGTVASVDAQIGQAVQAADILARLDPATVSGSVASAQANLADAQNAYNQVARPDEATVSAAVQTLASAFTSWQQAQNTLSMQLGLFQASGNSSLYNAWYYNDITLVAAQNELPLANASIDVQAYYQAALTSAQLAIQLANAQALATANPGQSLLAQRVSDLHQALTDSQSTQATLKAVLTSTQAEQVDSRVEKLMAYEKSAQAFIASVSGSYQNAIKLTGSLATFQQAGQKVSAAILSLYSLERIPDPAAYAKANASLQTAQQAANALYLLAPFEGTVGALYAQPGDFVTANSTGAVVLDRSKLFVTVQVQESKLVQLAIGDLATVTLEALPDLKLTGKVVAIDPVGVANQGVVYYNVRVELDQADSQIPLDATADVTIQAGDPKQELAVPVAAVQNDSTGEYVYVVAADGSSQRVDVVSGQIQADDTVVVQGNLKVGDKVLLLQSSSTTSTTGRGGGGFFPGP
jgi:HlyD family secretion protein